MGRAARHRNRETNVKIVVHVGIDLLRMLHIQNINEKKYIYREMDERIQGAGPEGAGFKPQAPSFKPQAQT
jgi:hypothetical protein